MNDAAEVDLKSLARTILAEVSASHPIGRTVNLEWRRYRVTAGMAYYKTFSIGLSLAVLKTPEQLRTTLLHEYAHLMAVSRAGRQASGHGADWREAMLQLGLAPKVTHNYEVKHNRKCQQVGYRCARCGEVLTRSRKLPKRRRYVHARCGGDLGLAYVRMTKQPGGGTAASPAS